MLIKILYVILVLSTLALLGAAAAGYVRVRRHLASRAHVAEGDTGKTPVPSSEVISSTERQ